jgi:two-component sensor histidine kinase
VRVDFEELTRSDPTATLLVTAQGRIAALNAEAVRALALKQADDLLAHLATPPDETLAFLRACSGSAEPRPGRLDFRDGRTVRSLRCDGARLRPPEPGSPALIVLRLRPLEQAHSVFAALTEQIAELNGEIQRRRRAEAQVKQALAEKDVLLREVQHRVRNNMQLIASMVELEARRSPSAREALSEVGSRVRAIALAQEQLYERDSVAEIELAAYLQSLVRATEALRGGAVSFSFSGEPAVVPLDRAVPVGLIVNELLTNAAKHAFPGGEGAVQVSLARQAGALVVEVVDDGVGLPSGAGLEKAGSLGFRLVRQLAVQAGAAIQIDGSSGVRARIQVPVPSSGHQRASGREGERGARRV